MKRWLLRVQPEGFEASEAVIIYSELQKAKIINSFIETFRPSHDLHSELDAHKIKSEGRLQIVETEL